MTDRDWTDFAITAALIAFPILGLTLYIDSISKHGPCGLPVYLLPLATALLTAGIVSATVRYVGRNRPDRRPLHVGFGCLASVLLIASYCGGWGTLWFNLFRTSAY